MGRKVKYSPEEKICAVNEYLAGKASIQSIADKLGIDFTSLQLWINNYEANILILFKPPEHNKV